MSIHVNKLLFVFLLLICLLLQGSQLRTQKGRGKLIFPLLQGRSRLEKARYTILSTGASSVLSVTSAVLSSTGDLYPWQVLCLRLPNEEFYQWNGLTKRWNLKWHLSLGGRKIYCTGSGFLPGNGPHIAGSFFPLLPLPWTPDSVAFIFSPCPFSFCLMRPVVAESLIDTWYVQLVFIFLRKGIAQKRIANGNHGGISESSSSIPSSSVPHPSGRKCHWLTSGWREEWLLQ